jgi:integrase
MSRESAIKIPEYFCMSAYLITPLRQQMTAALQLRGKGAQTQQAYVREVRLLAQFYGKSPDQISEEELPTYFLHRKNVDGLAPASMCLYYKRAGITKRDIGLHTLRHSYATYLLEAGVNLRVMQRYMGHAQLDTTMVYLHLTQKGQEDASQRINSAMRGFQL